MGCVLLLIILVLAVMAGAVTIPVGDVWLALTSPGTTEDYRIIYTLRMPRVICAALAGANLALSGFRRSMVNFASLGITFTALGW